MLEEVVEQRRRDLARARRLDVGIAHGGPVMCGVFEGDGWGQGFGLRIDMEFVVRLMKCFGVERLSDADGKPCWVTHTHSSILLVEPLLPKEGEAFDVEAWRESKRSERHT